MKKLSSISALIISMLFFGCASIVHGPIQTVSITSQPKGARLTIDGKDYGITPGIVSLPRLGRSKGDPQQKISYAVKIELEGFYPYELTIKREMDTWVVGNILIGGIVGLIIDAATGSMYNLYPDQIVAPLVKQNEYVSGNGATILDVDRENDLGKIYYPTGKLILYRPGKKENDQLFDFSINDSINGSFAPYSYMEVNIAISDKPVIICYNNGCESIYKVDLGIGETKYIELSMSKNENLPQIKEIEPRNGEFYAEQAKFYQEKRERK